MYRKHMLDATRKGHSMKTITVSFQPNHVHLGPFYTAEQTRAVVADMGARALEFLNIRYPDAQVKVATDGDFDRAVLATVTGFDDCTVVEQVVYTWCEGAWNAAIHKILGD